MDFDAEETEETSSPCTFRLGGREWACRPADQVPFSLIQRLVDVGGDDQKMTVQIAPFFRSTLAPEQVNEFMAMLDKPDSALTIGRVSKVMNHITTYVLSRPTERPSASGGGSRTTRATSKAASSSRATKAAAS
jgi:hypothetical protein